MNELIAVNKRVLDDHQAHLIKMQERMSELLDSKNKILQELEAINHQRGILHHEVKILKETLNLLENG